MFEVGRDRARSRRAGADGGGRRSGPCGGTGTGVPWAATAVLLCAGAWAAIAWAKDPPRLPPADRFRALVLEVLRSYPADGTHDYYWPKTGSWAGTTRTLTYDGQTVADGDPQGRSYCCGLTFEVFFRAWERWCTEEKRPFRIADLSAEDLLRFRGLWYGVDGDRRLIQNAVVAYRLGAPVDRLEDARPGDFVQFWRHSGSGHSVVLLDWLRDADGKLIGLRYWSSQKATRGIGEREERFGETEGVDRNQVYVARVGEDRPAPPGKGR